MPEKLLKKMVIFVLTNTFVPGQPRDLWITRISYDFSTFRLFDKILKQMKPVRIYLIIALILTAYSCKDDDEFPSYMKGIVKFKPYETSRGMQDLVFADNEIRFVVDMQLGSSAKNLDIEVDYHLLEGTQVISEGTVRVNYLLDAGLGIYWGSDENYIPIDGVAMRGKTLTVYLDPEHTYTAENYTNETLINRYKKASITIP